MPMNTACVGREYPPVTINVTLDALQKSALAYNAGNPAFFDANRPGGIIAPPTFGVSVNWAALMKAMMDPDLHVDLLRLVHGEQDMEFPNPIHPGDVITANAKIVSIEAKTTGETMTVELNAANQEGQPVQKTLFIIFIRGARNRDAGSSEPRPVQPDRGDPLFSLAQTIDKDHTFRYADASGDPNPIHVVETAPKMAV